MPQALLVISAFSTGASLIQRSRQGAAQRRAAERERDARRLERRRADVAAQRKRNRAIREGMQRRAELISRGATAGALDSSAISGGVSAIGSQTASLVSFLDRDLDFQARAESFREEAAAEMSRAQSFSQSANTLSTVGGLAWGAGGKRGFETFFDV